MNSLQRSIRYYERLGLTVVLAGVGGASAWAAFSSLSSAVVAPAVVVVESSAKKVQHLEGGVIAATLIRNGDHVSEGQILVKLDDTEARANLQIYSSQLAELNARHDRLVAERDGQADIEVGGDPANVSLEQAQAKLLKARMDVRLGKKQQLTERIGQLEEEVTGLSAQLDSKDRQIALITKERDSLRALREQRLVPESRWLALEREIAGLDGERGRLASDISRTKVQIGETRLQLIAVDQNFLSDVLAELRDVEAKVNELTEKVAAVRARLLRIDIKAPQSGVVHKLTATTVGGVVGAGEVIAEIIPEDRLVLEGHVDPGSIDRLHFDQRVVVRFPTLNRRLTPELGGTVTMISPDVRQDSPNQPPYYLVRVRLDEGASLGSSHQLKPGMPAELQFQTGERSPLSYLIKPLADQMNRALREQ